MSDRGGQQSDTDQRIRDKGRRVSCLSYVDAFPGGVQEQSQIPNSSQEISRRKTVPRSPDVAMWALEKSLEEGEGLKPM